MMSRHGCGLVACHDEYQHLFSGVTRIRLSQVPYSLRYIPWDTQLRRLVSVAEYWQQVRQRHLALIHS